jgi:hypothetical protein
MRRLPLCLLCAVAQLDRVAQVMHIVLDSTHDVGEERVCDWTGDIAVYAPTAAYLFDVEDFLRDWLADLVAEQRAANGMVGYVVPDALKYMKAPSQFPRPETTAIWSDAAAGCRGPSGRRTGTCRYCVINSTR